MSNTIKPVSFELSSPQYGWISVKIFIGDKEDEANFSAVFDPFEDLLHWLESLALGVQEASFVFDVEGCVVFYKFRKKLSSNDLFFEENTDILEISASCNDEIVWDYVDRKQLITEIYTSVIDYAKSNDYQENKNHWELQTYEDILIEIMELDTKQLKATLLDFEKQDFADLIINLEPEISFSDQITEEQKQDFYKNQKNRINKLLPKSDNLTKEEKQKYVDKFLKSSYKSGAQKFSKFRSKIVEEYLNKD